MVQSEFYSFMVSHDHKFLNDVGTTKLLCKDFSEFSKKLRKVMEID